MTARNTRFALVCVIALAAATMFVGCTSDSGSAYVSISAAGGTVRIDSAEVTFVAGTFDSVVLVDLSPVVYEDLATTPNGDAIGGFNLQVDSSPTFFIPATARIRLTENQQGVDTLPVYERRSGSWSKVGDANVSTDGGSVLFESGIIRDGLYVVGPPKPE